MSRLKNFLAVWLSVFVIITYFIMYSIVGYYYSKFTADIFAIIGLSYMAASTFPVAVKAMRRGIRTDWEQYIVSYWLIWTMVLIHRCWVIFLALVEQNEWWRYGPISGFIALGFALAGGFGAAAPLTGDIPVNRKEFIIFTVAALFSGVMAGIAIGTFLIAGLIS